MSEQRATIDLDAAAHKAERRFEWITKPRALGRRRRLANVREPQGIETSPVAVDETRDPLETPPQALDDGKCLERQVPSGDRAKRSRRNDDRSHGKNSGWIRRELARGWFPRETS